MRAKTIFVLVYSKCFLHILFSEGSLKHSPRNINRMFSKHVHKTSFMELYFFKCY